MRCLSIYYVFVPIIQSTVIEKISTHDYKAIQAYFHTSLASIFSGGLTNVVLYCSLPQSSLKSHNPSNTSSVPTEVLLRLYGAIYYRDGYGFYNDYPMTARGSGLRLNSHAKQ